MIRAAFYAPMKSPNHPVASGDRAIARALLRALDAADVSVDLASEVQTRDGIGDKQAQRDLSHRARRETEDLIPRGQARGWQVWITYHNYYKAPDLIGPSVCAALGIPYIQIESTRARGHGQTSPRQRRPQRMPPTLFSTLRLATWRRWRLTGPKHKNMSICAHFSPVRHCQMRPPEKAVCSASACFAQGTSLPLTSWLRTHCRAS